jgi:hypothetical protein
MNEWARNYFILVTMVLNGVETEAGRKWIFKAVRDMLDAIPDYKEMPEYLLALEDVKRGLANRDLDS